jgi:homocysteine S-methyltransferase
MGTELERRGPSTRLPLWSVRALIECPELVLAIHRERCAGGAEILTANTFRTHRRTLAARD